MSELQLFECVGSVLNVVLCPGISNVVFVNSVGGGVKSLLIGLFVNGSRSYNLKRKVI